jgi:hypothetical protein
MGHPRAGKGAGSIPAPRLLSSSIRFASEGRHLMGEGLRRARAAARATRATPKRITKARAARLVAAMEAIRECSDISYVLSIAMDDCRAAISPYYDTEDGE